MVFVRQEGMQVFFLVPGNWLGWRAHQRQRLLWKRPSDRIQIRCQTGESDPQVGRRKDGLLKVRMKMLQLIQDSLATTVDRVASSLCFWLGTGEKAGALCLPTEPWSLWIITTTREGTGPAELLFWPSGMPGKGLLLSGCWFLLLLVCLAGCSFHVSFLVCPTNRLYKMAVGFMLAHPYGFTRVMSSFRWPRYFENGKVSL